MRTIVVSRHETFIQHLRNIGLVDDDTEIISHVYNEDQIKEAHVIGMLPLHLAALTEKITFVPLNLTFEQRQHEKNTGQELSIEEIESAAGEPKTYFVNEIDEEQINNFDEEVILRNKAWVQGNLSVIESLIVLISLRT